MTIKAVLFDFDGTLADSNELIAQSHLYVLERYFPGKFDRDSVKELNGPSLEETYGQLNPTKKVEMIQLFREYNQNHHDQMLSLFPDVEPVLHQLREQNFKLAIISAKRREVLDHGLKLMGIENSFDELIGSGEYQRPKPQPEALLKVAQRLGVPIEECVMVGDSLADVGAAHAAGIRCIFVGWSEKPIESMPLNSDDVVVNSMRDLELWIQKNK